MRHTLFALLSTCLLSSCFKPAQKLIFSFNASYDSTNTTANVVNVNVEKTSGDDDIVNLKVDGLPDYITADFPTSGKTPINTSIAFRLSTLAERNVSNWKNYTVTITATSNAGITRSQDVTFFCYPNDATQAFFGRDFFAHEQCTPSGSELRSVSTLTPGGNRIVLMDFFTTDIFTTISLPATVDGRKRTITIAPFTQDGYTFRGDGTFYPTSGDSLGCTINFSRSRLGLFDTCSTILTMGY
jgi:hypothetical protein